MRSMADEFTEFLWRVPSTGHRWIEGQPIGGEGPSARRFLIAEARPGQLAHADEYNPLRAHSALFQTFAETETSEEGILGFANRFGCLGGHARVTVSVKMPDGTQVFPYGELEHKWTAEILTMRSLIRLWELVKKRDQVGLREFIRWTKDAASLHLPPTAGRGHTVSTIKASSQLQSGDTLMAAVYLAQRTVNDKLADGVRARLLWDARRAEHGLRLVPQSLIGCLWLQFAKAIEGNRSYRQCGNCQGWFELGGSRGARADKKFCSPSCKANAHRKKREEAVRLFSTRVAVREIARQLDTDLATVKSWVRK